MRASIFSKFGGYYDAVFGAAFTQQSLCSAVAASPFFIIGHESPFLQQQSAMSQHESLDLSPPADFIGHEPPLQQHSIDAFSLTPADVNA